MLGASANAPPNRAARTATTILALHPRALGRREARPGCSPETTAVSQENKSEATPSVSQQGWADSGHPSVLRCPRG